VKPQEALREAGFEPPFNICGSCHHKGGDHSLSNVCLLCGDRFSEMTEEEAWAWGIASLPEGWGFGPIADPFSPLIIEPYKNGLRDGAQQERERLRERDPFGDDWNRPYKMPEKWDTPLELLYHFQEWLLAEPSDEA